MTYDDLKDIQAFLKNHKDEIDANWYKVATDAALQLEYWFLDGRPSKYYDHGFYERVVSAVVNGFVKPGDTDWYDYPEDFPKYYESKLIW